MTPKVWNVKPNDLDNIRVPFLSTEFEYILRGEKFFDYTRKKICYKLRNDKDENSNLYKIIQHLKLIYLNKESKEKILLDTSNGKELPEIIGLFEGEEVIEYVIV